MVMVPVLSRRSVFTSPAASTARPLRGQHVVLHQTIHARDADCREQATDGCRDQADQQRHQHKDRLRRPGVDGEWLQRDDSEQKNDGEAGQQNVQRDLIRRLLTLRAFDKRNHAIEKGLARIGRDADRDLVAQARECHRSPQNGRRRPRG